MDKHKLAFVKEVANLRIKLAELSKHSAAKKHKEEFKTMYDIASALLLEVLVQRANKVDEVEWEK